MKRLFQVLGAGAMALLLVGCSRSEFGAPVDLPAITAALTQTGLQVCGQTELDWAVTPGFVEGVYFDVGVDCAAYDAGRPDARVYVARFDSPDARDAAQRSFETTYRRHPGAGVVRAAGPWLITIDGNLAPGAVVRLREALAQFE